MSQHRADRNLLFGILALQLDFIGREELIAAMSAWVLDKARPLGQILLDRGSLGADNHALLEALVQRHLELHAHDPQRSLAALRSLPSVQAELSQIADADVQASLAPLAPLTPTQQGGSNESGSLSRADPEATTGYPALHVASAEERFEILRPHARGGLGEVFVALDRELHREVALKEIQGRHADDPENRARFLLEAEITGGLEHPGIVPVYGLGTYADGRPFYAMRLIQGDSLKDAIHAFHATDWRNRPAHERALALRQLLGRFLDLCNAIAYAHSKGVLHRDLKPGNVMLGQYGETLVVDWGLAKRVGQAEQQCGEAVAAGLQPAATGGRPGSNPLTQMGKALGTPAYMSPEQAAGRLDRLGPQSDVYGLGATLYTLLSGQAPFTEGDAVEILLKVQKGDFPPPGRANRLVPPALDAVCLKAMALAPEERYASPRELAGDIERWLADEPVSVHRETWSVRLGRWLRRHQTLAAGAAVLLLTGVLALGVSTLVVGRAQRETARALHQEEQARRDRALARVEALLNAEPDAVPALLADLETAREDVEPQLRAVWAGWDNQADPRRRARAGLALLPVEAALVKDWLFARLLEVKDPREMLLIRDGFRPHRADLVPRLWQRIDSLRGKGAKEAGRLRALAALADYDPASPRWPAVRREVVRGLVTVNPLHLPPWAQAFRPLRGLLIDPLGEVFRDAKRPESERERAADLLADYAGDRPEVLADLIVEADPRTYGRLLPRLKGYGDRAAALLARELERKPAPSWQDPPPDAGWSPPDPKLVREIEGAHGLFAERFALVQTLPLERFVAVAEGLRPAGYRPVRVRPFRQGNDVRVAAVWTRDTRDWRLAAGLAAAELPERLKAWRQDGFAPTEVAAYEAPTADKTATLRYVTLWARRGDAADTRMIYGVPAAWLQSTHDGLKAAGYNLASFHVLRASDRRRYYSSVWTKEPVFWTSRWFSDEPEYEALLTPARVQVDVGLVRANPPRARTAADHKAKLEQAEKDLKENRDVRKARLARAVALTSLGRDREALASWDDLIATAPLGELYWFRAVAHARLSDEKKARQDLAAFKVRTPAPLAWETLEALVNAYLGRDQEALKALEDRLQKVRRNTELTVTTASIYSEVARWIAARHPDRARAYRDRAAALLHEAVAQGFHDYRTLFTDEHFDGLRRHPEFVRLVGRVSLDRQYAAVWHGLSTHESQEVHGLDPVAHLRRCRQLVGRGYRPAAVAVLEPATGKPLVTASVWHHPLVTEAGRDALARRQARAAATLVHFGRSERLWPLLRHSPDPRVRSFLVHYLEPLGVAPLALIKRLQAEPNVSARRALLLALGEYPYDRLPQAELRPLVQLLLETFRTDPDPGIHSAVDWLLRRWLLGSSLAQTQAELPVGPTAERDWFCNRAGQTFAVVRGPKTFYMGSPETEPEARGDETLHLVRIEHSFAIATREVTQAELRRFFARLERNSRPDKPRRRPEDDEPMDGVSWVDAATYCRRLSELEGVPEDQMCFPPVEELKAGMKLPPDYLSRTGYRLPTEAEWEYACRAGAATRRFYGSAEELLDRYGWFLKNSEGRPHPVGRLKPNDLGLFDVYGNALEWCMEAHSRYEQEKGGRATVYKEDRAPVVPGRLRLLRGGSYDSPAGRLRSAGRSGDYPFSSDAQLGFRIVRTLR
jgi:formylglycine-generating enzyme required for sulfatase activity/tRNA A-37 threonylcarbamoyl transferase component Bud32